METTVVVLLVILGIAILAFLATAIFFFVKLLKLGKLLRSDLMPVSGKFAFWGALAYSVIPLDLLPDPIYLDDIGIIVAAISYITHLARKYGILGDRRSAEPKPMDTQHSPEIGPSRR